MVLIKLHNILLPALVGVVCFVKDERIEEYLLTDIQNIKVSLYCVSNRGFFVD
jgi:hypothetical protein